MTESNTSANTNETVYTDEDFLNATQVAYLNFDPDTKQKVKDLGLEPTLANYLMVDPQNMEFAQDKLAEAQAKLEEMELQLQHTTPEKIELQHTTPDLYREVRGTRIEIGTKDTQSDLSDSLMYREAEKEVIRWEERIEFLEETQSNENGCGDWKIVTSVNESGVKESGFAACIIETGEGEAIVAFRGSESEDKTMFQKDWIEADLMLLDSTLTWQQARATAYMDDVVEQVAKENGYESLTLTGHLLGGNLAHHAAVTAPEYLKSKIVQAYSFDGPGFSEEYHGEHGDQEKSMGGKLTHYQWSPVGAIFTQMEGAFDMPISTGQYTSDVSFQKHDTCFARFGMEGGFVQKGYIDKLARASGWGRATSMRTPTSRAACSACSPCSMNTYTLPTKTRICWDSVTGSHA
jgi:hypothetical protein